MAQKIYDIMPVKREVFQSEKKINKDKTPRSFKKFILYLFLIIFLSSGFWAYFSFSTAEIEIWIKKDSLDFKETIIVNPNIEYVDVIEKNIPGKIFSETRSEKQNFSSTGKKMAEEKAKGVIRVYNNHSTEPQTLIAETRFVSSEGKIFRSVKRETIPGGKYVGGKLEPGFLDIEVRAAETGEDYNIEPTSFSIPGFVGTAKYVDFYGKSSLPMEGGFKGETSVITSEDIEKAKKILYDNILKETYSSVLKKEESKDFVFLGENIVFKEEVINESSSFNEGSLVSDFDYELEMKIEFLGFKKSDIKILADNLVKSNIEEDKKIKEDSFNISYNNSQLKDDLIIIEADYRVEIYTDLNIIEIKKMIVGEYREKMKENISIMPQVERMQINSWPLLKNKAPLKEEDIEIKINI